MNSCESDPAQMPCANDIDLAALFNRSCSCRTLDPRHLRADLDAYMGVGVFDEIVQSRPHLFSNHAVFLTREQFQHLADIVTAVEEVLVSADYQSAALARAPAIAGFDPGPIGTFASYDFHLGRDGPALIEINTNAGGALLNTLLARAQRGCCRTMDLSFEPSSELETLEQRFLEMFIAEWHRQGRSGTPATIAIVDDAPTSQYLYPEFQLFEIMFRRAGIRALIADASELDWHEGNLRVGGQTIDMVYNRLTDFYFEQLTHAALRSAYLSAAAVVTPNPRAHALYADKRNLIFLSDPQALAAASISAANRAILATGIPHTVAVTAASAAHLWAERRDYFFKPAAGYGSKATYRGDKLTRRVWEEIQTGEYVAQALVQPSLRRLEIDAVETDLKLDLRAYTYAGKVQLLAARLYSGQTTNFRTEGGGFAPVFVATATSPVDDSL
jgi:hypothetical protein